MKNIIYRICTNINIFNIILIFIFLFFFTYIFFPAIQNTSTLLNIKAINKDLLESEEDKRYSLNLLSISEYSIISDQNIFHPERIIQPEKKSEQEQKQETRPEILLYGTIITDNFKLAYIEDIKSPVTTPGRGKRQIAVKEGDTFGGFTVKNIETDKILLVKGEEKMSVYMHDGKRTKLQGIPISSGDTKNLQKTSKQSSSLEKERFPQTATDAKILQLFEKGKNK